jgi:lactoylglutathione lyase
MSLLMNIERYGIILNVEKYEACVNFYRDVFELKVMFSKIEGDFKLTCLEFGSSYLMIETEGFAEHFGKSIKICPSKFRFNVSDIDAALERVKSLDIPFEFIKSDWGSTINMYDPDGNRIGIRDEISFLHQINA